MLVFCPMFVRKDLDFNKAIVTCTLNPTPDLFYWNTAFAHEPAVV